MRGERVKRWEGRRNEVRLYRTPGLSFSKARLTAVALASGAAALLGASSTNTYTHSATHTFTPTHTRTYRLTEQQV